MSGAGKSAALEGLASRGYSVVETDDEGWCEWGPVATSESLEWVWNEQAIAELLREHAHHTLFVSGTVSNQVKFYDTFDSIVLLTAPLESLLERIENRTSNNYGKSEVERARVIGHVATVEPRLRASATDVIDTRRPLVEVIDELVSISHRRRVP